MTERFTAGRVPDAGIAQLFATEHRWQSWLDVEAALALSEADLGMLPTEAGDAISAACRTERLDLARVQEGIARTSHPLMPLITELTRVVGEPHGGWVHWGATTQNITQTGDVLVLREAHRTILAQLGRVMVSLAELTEQSAEVVMAGRTHGQHAVPITFGFKTASWLDELERHGTRLQELAPRLSVAIIGGAVGTFASFGKHGDRVQEAVADRLGLRPMRVPARSITDHFAEFGCTLGLLAGTAGRIAREVYTLMKTEYGEVEEPVPAGTVGSSTMPQKRNPQLCQDILGITAEIRALVPLMLESLHNEHEADHTPSGMFDALARACILTGDTLERLDLIARELVVNPERMRRNLDLTGGAINAETVMLELGTKIGRQRAHDIVYQAAQKSATDHSTFSSLLAEEPGIAQHLTGAEMTALLDPASHIGRSADIARSTATEGRRASASIHCWLAGTDRGHSPVRKTAG
ncbi:adenylosuccinate lyase family protein [Saccharopolyspora sp. WRP15-2]|uniref:Adenylosuccinate lyase family protein n=1 Tax=Saccharopolyspora oryzae TaxID=2997343 RepID=A0ABT4UVK4_9PSEU|nr:adenylosuccinate lyase family protein [Saccharopolyspora oryzae]MDA3625714.1 adenylosuccinate lyase family protein [Saccharopolyspora oryzae]